MELALFLDKSLGTLLTLLIYLIVVYALKKSSKKSMIKRIREPLRFELADWKKTILIPAAISLIPVLVFFGLTAYDEPLWFNLVFRSVLQPVAEEIAVRGFILGLIFLTFPVIAGPDESRSYYKIWLMFALILTSLFFGVEHGPQTQLELIYRSVSGLLYGSLYIFNRKNLLPPTIAHITNNLAVVLLDTWVY